MYVTSVEPFCFVQVGNFMVSYLIALLLGNCVIIPTDWHVLPANTALRL